MKTKEHLKKCSRESIFERKVRSVRMIDSLSVTSLLIHDPEELDLATVWQISVNFNPDEVFGLSTNESGDHISLFASYEGEDAVMFITYHNGDVYGDDYDIEVELTQSQKTELKLALSRGESLDLLKEYQATGYTPKQIVQMQSAFVDLQTKYNKLLRDTSPTAVLRVGKVERVLRKDYHVKAYIQIGDEHGMKVCAITNLRLLELSSMLALDVVSAIGALGYNRPKGNTAPIFLDGFANNQGVILDSISRAYAVEKDGESAFITIQILDEHMYGSALTEASIMNVAIHCDTTEKINAVIDYFEKQIKDRVEGACMSYDKSDIGIIEIYQNGKDSLKEIHFDALECFN